MTRRLLWNARLLDPEAPADRAGEPGALLLAGGRIEAVLRAPTPRDLDALEARREDAGGAFVAPGFLDLHVHGSLVTGSARDVRHAVADVAASSVRHGATGFLATTVALPRPELLAQVRALAAALDAPSSGALPLGIHLEGPWIDPGAAGAQPVPGIRPPDAAELEALLAAAAGRVRLVTLAPELDGAAALLAALARHGVVAALGHSRAPSAAIERAIDLGLRHVTHLFNAMSPVHHRELGVAGHALADDRLTCDLIADGVHVDPRLVRVAARAKGSGLMLITDRIEMPGPGAEPSIGGGMAPGGLSQDGEAWRLADGRLAGSTLQLDRAVANVTRWGAMTRVYAVAACTLRPARLLGLEAERGTLRPGARADLVLLDEAGAVRETWIAGERVYAAGPGPAPEPGGMGMGGGAAPG